MFFYIILETKKQQRHGPSQTSVTEPGFQTGNEKHEDVFFCVTTVQLSRRGQTCSGVFPSNSIIFFSNSNSGVPR